MRVRGRFLLSAAAWLGIVLFTPARGADFHVHLTCSSETYARGDSVWFVWRNDTDSTLTAGSHEPYEIYTLENQFVYGGPYPMEYDLDPRSRVDLVWDQHDVYGHAVPAGSYEVRIDYVFNDTPPGHTVADTFRIVPQTAVPATDWGAVKLAFR
jgi:hypothetical protein